MFFLFKRNRILYTNICSYLDIVTRIMETFKKLVGSYLKEVSEAKLAMLVEQVDNDESDADDALVDIRKMLYNKSMLPESREDILVMLDKVDDIADCANHTAQFIFSHGLNVPDEFRDDIRELLKTSLKSFNLVMKTVHSLFEHSGDLLENTRIINNYESMCDNFQLKLIKKVFASNIKDIDKILMRDLIKWIGRISDVCEDTADIITLLYIKRAI
jgi:predicted phosphate transport protein (TIGR00153 family)